MKRLIEDTKRKAKRREEAAQTPTRIGSPSDLILHVPRPRFDANGVPIQATDHEIDGNTMRIALINMANYLSSKGQTLTVIAVGGAVNVLLLRSRQSTHDLDFFGTNLSNTQRVALDEAAHFAEAQTSKPLGAEWFNNQTLMWMSPSLHRQLTEQALQQNEVVFQHGGLTVVAAPWMYALAAKTHRIAQARRGERAARARPYDATDAATYLHMYIQQNGGGVQRLDELEARCVAYGFQVSRIDLQAVGVEYRRLYHVEGVIG